MNITISKAIQWKSSNPAPTDWTGARLSDSTYILQPAITEMCTGQLLLMQCKKASLLQLSEGAYIGIPLECIAKLGDFNICSWKGPSTFKWCQNYHNWDFCSFITYTVDNPLFEALKHVLTSAAFKPPNYFKLLRNN
jgi:hypothetical protein